MKIAIVDDQREPLSTMEQILREGGCEDIVLILTADVLAPPGAETLLHLRDIAARLKNGGFDRVLLDHDLGMGACDSGREVALEAELSRDVLIGTSTAHNQTSYCAKQFYSKSDLNIPEMRHALLQMLL